jgi:hypothetical protein
VKENAVKVAFEPGDIADEFNADPEFRLCARFWNGLLEFGVGDRVYGITLAEGEVAAVTVSDALPLPEEASTPGSRRVRISAPDHDWSQLVKTLPPPFYLDYYGASAHHGFELGGDPETLWAYYPAIRRTSDLFRAIAKVTEDR